MADDIAKQTLEELKAIKSETAKAARLKSIADKLQAAALKEENVYQQKMVDNSNASLTHDEKTAKELKRAYAEDTKLLVAADKRDTSDVAKKDAAEMAQRARDEKSRQILEKIMATGTAGQKLQARLAKMAATAKGKVKDFAKDKIESIKKGAANLLDILKKGLMLGALFLLFKWIQTWDIEGLLEGAKKVGTFLTEFGGFWLSLATSIGAWVGLEKIKALFTGKEGSLTKKLKSMKDTIKLWFTMAKESKFITGLKNSKFLTQLTGKDSFFSKIKNLFGKIGGLFKKIPGIEKILKFVKGAGKLLGKIFVPVTVIMALWEAVTGFMDGFANTEGNMFQKILGGIGGAVKSLLDFFIFGIADMIQSAIVWLLELFGFDGAAVAVGDFNLVGRIKDAVFKAIDFVTELFSFRDTSLSGIFKSLVDILMLPLNLAVNFIKDLFGWGDPEEPFKFSEFIIDTWNTVVAWVKGLFSWGMAAGETEDGAWSIMTFINSVIKTVKGWVTGLFSWASTEDEGDSFIVATIKKMITGIKAMFNKLFKFDSTSDIITSMINIALWLPNLVKEGIAAITTWLLKLFGFDEAAQKVADANKFSIGEMIMNVLSDIVEWLNKMFDIDIGAIFKKSLGALGEAGEKVLGWLGFDDDAEKKTALTNRMEEIKAIDMESQTPDQRIQLRKEMGMITGELAKLGTGGTILPGGMAIVGEGNNGGELVINTGQSAAKVIPAKQSADILAGNGGGSMVNAPTTVVNNNQSSGSTTMAMAANSIDPMHMKYFRN